MNIFYKILWLLNHVLEWCKNSLTGLCDLFNKTNSSMGHFLVFYSHGVKNVNVFRHAALMDQCLKTKDSVYSFYFLPLLLGLLLCPIIQLCTEVEIVFNFTSIKIKSLVFNQADSTVSHGLSTRGARLTSLF